MIPQPEYPKAVVFVDEEGTLVRVASNIRNIDIQIVNNKLDFDHKALGLPFNPVCVDQ